jgi:hypothetical protein
LAALIPQRERTTFNPLTSISGVFAAHHVSDHAPRARCHGPAERAMAGGRQQFVHTARANDARAVGCHGAQATPEAGLEDVIDAREQVGHPVFQRAASGFTQGRAEARLSGRAADRDAVAQARDGDLVCLSMIVDSGAQASSVIGTVMLSFLGTR